MRKIKSSKEDLFANALAKAIVTKNLSEKGHKELSSFLRLIDESQIHYTRYAQELERIEVEESTFDAIVSPALLAQIRSKPGKWSELKKKVNISLKEFKKQSAAAGNTVRAIQELVYNAEPETLNKIFNGTEN